MANQIAWSRFVCLVLFGLLTACGGGEGNPGQCVGSDAVCLRSVIQQSVTAANVTTVIPATSLCGIDVGTKRISGLVTGVHDGDTLTIVLEAGQENIRLDSIDAPELAQPFGEDARIALTRLVLGKVVEVAYNKRDRYGRIVGAVFTEGCRYVNLDQVANGLAWFYKAYQCEISAPTRQLFLQAQANAVMNRLGLWTQDTPEAPWFYRNGIEPATPSCTGDAPTYTEDTALSALGQSLPVNSNGPTITPNGTTTTTSGAAACYTGPRGGTYTLTASGKKNYSGC